MKKLTLESIIVGGFIAALVLLLLAGGQMYRSLKAYMNTSKSVAHTHLVLEAIEEVRLVISELTGNQRTYIITGKEIYLAKNETGEVKIRSALVRLTQLTADNLRQQARSTLLSQLTEERLKLMNNNVELYRTSGFTAARDRINNGIAAISMDAMQNQCNDMREEELTLLKQRTALAESHANQALVIGALLVAATLVGLPLVWWCVRRSEQERQARKSLVQESELLKHVSDDLVREDKINKAYGDVLTLINHDWFTVKDLIQAALTQLDGHVAIMAGVCHLVQEQGLLPLSAIVTPLPATTGEIVHEAMRRNRIVTIKNIPPDSFFSLSTGVGNIVPHEIIAVPLTSKNEVVAVLELASLHGFEDTERLIINRIAPQLGIGINSIKIGVAQKKLEQDVMERSSQLEVANYELQTINEQSRGLNDSLQLLNEELQARQTEIAESNRRLEDVSRSKSDFLANMSHELRTPLNSVIGFSEVLQDQLFGTINDKQQEYVTNILTSGKHLLSLINDILDLSKVESGKMELELSNFSIRDAVDAAQMMLREKAMKGGIELRCTISPEADINIAADQRKLKQILFNLLSNAIKFTPTGGSVNVNAARDGDYLEIHVADTGIGIKKEDITKLFQAFTQLESVYTKGFEGTGLGLALTKNLVKLHGGRVWVESEFGAGSRFSFTIPFSQPAF
ncbi:MAG: ATP-binding protein [Desulfuromonadaceae bacterium]